MLVANGENWANYKIMTFFRVGFLIISSYKLKYTAVEINKVN